ncbi:MAG: UDP-2,4-diacetamido-2,4,6-trideoxy-beta-L-altropyranose hydrolase [Candidatus Omnitrophota bacterium]|nr:MAG: UDP-2,4-diacetamido-2,4,6-trideoxy-beta-L-altropyranose hydrolase [Candidatus Omnitrophota bacterium]
MKTLIITEGGNKLGFGHVTRCLSLYQAFEEKGISAGIIVGGDRSVKKALKRKKANIFNWLKEEKKLLSLAKDKDIVIIDSYLAPKALYEKLSSLLNGGILVMIDDNKRINYPQGVVINPSIYAERLNYPQKEGLHYLLGKDYIILRREFRNIHKKKINKQLKNVLIALGGSNYSELSRRIIGYLKDKFDFNFYAVEPKKNMLSARAMIKLMRGTDTCISGGGQTTYELARCGVPAIGICLADNQLSNLKSWAALGFLEFAGWFNEKKLFENIEKALRALDYKKRLKMSEVGRDLVDGRGAQRSIEEILRIKQGITLNAACKSDCEDIRIWRNHPLARRNSFNERPVSKQEHIRWFNSKMKDRNTKIYIARRGKEKLGVIRFALAGDSATASVNLNPDFFGRGLGTRLIRQGTEKLFQEAKTLKRVIAEIKRGNIASQKAFLKAGYEPRGETEEKLIYKKEISHV